MKNKICVSLLILLSFTLLLFISGCASIQQDKMILPKGESSALMMAPPEMICCHQYNSTYNWSKGYNDECCSLTELPDACIDCILNETQRQAEYPYPPQPYVIYRPSLLKIILSSLPLILIVLALLSLLILISDKITSVAKDSADGFLKYRWKKVLMIFVFSVLIVLLIFYVIIRIFG